MRLGAYGVRFYPHDRASLVAVLAPSCLSRFGFPVGSHRLFGRTILRACRAAILGLFMPRGLADNVLGNSGNSCARTRRNRARGQMMAKAKTANAALARLAQNREAIRAQAAALDAEEKALRKAMAREGAERLGAAFGRHDLGEISKGDATRFAKVVAALSFAGALARLEAK